MKHIQLLLILSLFSFQKLVSQHSYADYYYNLNKAVEAKRTNDDSTYRYCIETAYKELTEKENIDQWHYVALLKLYKKDDASLKKVINFIKDNPLLATKESIMYKAKKDRALSYLIEEYQVFTNPESEYIMRHEELSAKMDTIYAIEQLARGADWVDNSYVPEVYRGISILKADTHSFIELKKLFKEYGLFGYRDCKTCDISILLTHFDDFSKFEELDTTFKQLLKEGKLEPNLYAYAYDRSYNLKFGSFYYYFSMIAPINGENYVPVEELTDAEKEIINKRRAVIGIAPLPYEFGMFNDL